MILNKYHKPFKDASNYILNLYLQALIIFIIIRPVKGERRLTEKTSLKAIVEQTHAS